MHVRERFLIPATAVAGRAHDSKLSRWVRSSAVAGLLVAGSTLAACGASTTAVVVPPSSATAGAVTPQGFQAVVIRVTRPDGTVASFCVWLAATEAQREQGLMGVTSLGGADGMLFRFGADQTGTFWMKDTVVPLSIAFFAASGMLVSTADMAPCPSSESTCPVYGAAAPYTDALEVPQAGLGRLGVVPDARLAVTKSACEPKA
jgi:uncharacterized membrane protein (UPF0127 family)